MPHRLSSFPLAVLPKAVFAFGLLASAGIAAYAYRQVESLRGEAVARAEVRLHGAAHSVAEHFGRTLMVADITSRYLAQEWSEERPTFDQQVRDLILPTITGLSPQVAVLDRTGRLAYSSLPFTGPAPDLSEREHFKVHRERRVDGLFISKPVVGKVSGRETVQFTRAIRADGGFLGVVVVTTDPAELSETFAEVANGELGTVALAGTDGAIRSISVDGQYRPASLARPPLEVASLQADEGMVRAPKAMTAYLRVPGTEIFAMVSQSLDVVLADYWPARNRVVAGALATMAAALGGAALVAALIHRLLGMKEALAASERRYRLAVEGSHAAIWDWDVATDSLYVSEQLGEFLEIPHFQPHPREWLEMVDPAWRPRVRDALVAHLKGQAAKFDVEFPIAAQDGRVVWLHQRGVGLKEPDGRVYRMAGAITDITDRHDAETQARHAQKLDAMGQLAGGLAHEFNNLLSIIRGYTEMARDRLAGDPSGAADLGHVLDATDRGAALTRQLLVTTRKRPQLDTVFDLAETVNQASAMLAPLLGEAVGLTTEAPGGPLPVVGDPALMAQVIMNLAVNARDAMPKGGFLLISVATEGEQVLLTVRDSGTGMDEATRARIFEPFFTTKPPGQGTGLGLAMVYGVVKQMKGAITVDSRPGDGTTFAIRLTLARQANPGAQATRPSAAGTAAGRVLLVEDEPALRGLIARQLEAMGHVVLPAKDGVEALLLQEGEALDVVLTDVAMPGMDGRELARCLRAERPGLPIVFMTGHPDRVGSEGGGGLDGETVLGKPVGRETLMAAVAKAMEFGRAESRT